MTTPTPQQVTALENYVEDLSWEAHFVPESDFEQAAGLMLDAAAAGPDQSPAGRQKAAGDALYQAVVAHGYGSSITQDECAGAANVVLQAA